MKTGTVSIMLFQTVHKYIINAPLTFKNTAIKKTTQHNTPELISLFATSGH
jgi:hypothetical protein